MDKTSQRVSALVNFNDKHDFIKSCRKKKTLIKSLLSVKLNEFLDNPIGLTKIMMHDTQEMKVELDSVLLKRLKVTAIELNSSVPEIIRYCVRKEIERFINEQTQLPY